MIRVACYWLGLGMVAAGVFLAAGLIEAVERGSDELG